MTRDEFAALAVRYLGDVSAYARRLATNSADADDLVQDTFTRAFQRWQSLRDPAGCRAWLFRITRHLQIDHFRRAKARPDLHLVGPAETTGGRAPTVPAEVVERIEARELEIALRSLSTEQREAVLLCDLWGFPYAEIADIMRCPVGTVQSRVSRGRLALVQWIAAQQLAASKDAKR